MPFYSYICKHCNCSFQELLPVDERYVPCEAPCPECGNKEVEIEIGDIRSIWKCSKPTL